MKHLAMAVVVKQDKVLIQKRYRADRGMVFEFPGGKVRLDETGTDAAIRELAEETGIKGLEHTATYTKVNELGGRIYFVILRARQEVQPTVLNESIKQELVWFDADDIPHDEFFSADREFISQYLHQYIATPA
ncbi:NUDIX hydrolase [Vibrio ponticus]|uniref:8-oxo-dGTP diphosphatase n=1 Tax=Vibrio ponticus TaxID=265668 RepID=A0A3N3E1N5_9VIBR|nr:NUDIX hydrolase [Vibrio ponticus]ROV60653.1 NUDIX hydrolase [Vibrio ponticus]